nr:MAG TPA: hypothetical protein [Caudoviricetes sp.]
MLIVAVLVRSANVVLESARVVFTPAPAAVTLPRVILAAAFRATVPAALDVSAPRVIAACAFKATVPAAELVSVPSVMAAEPFNATVLAAEHVNAPNVGLAAPAILTVPVPAAVRLPSVMLAAPLIGSRFGSTATKDIANCKPLVIDTLMLWPLIAVDFKAAAPDDRRAALPGWCVASRVTFVQSCGVLVVFEPLAIPTPKT